MEPEKKKRKLVDLSTKLAILKYLDDGHSIRATADKFKLSKKPFNQPNRTHKLAPILQGEAKQIATQIGVDAGEFSVS
ncbi:hypothetical protein BASA84_000480 [Batrachochytrium salamandrivorans]|nr:hypothetical protein BASA84_000480 [Batrachochytrium salamandrivorans]